MEYNDLKSIKIRPITIDDFNFVLKWSKDNSFCLANGWEQNRKEEELFNWWLHCVNNISEDFIRLGVECKDRLIGYADLANIKDNSAELGIAIGESTLWGKGLGYTAALCMIDYASKKRGITSINAETHEKNFRSRKMLEKLGFKEISRVGYEEYLGTNNQLLQFKLII
ncbi:GNAT family N-acetyltransferase [Cytobacillus firmus]|uniref:GNAT family N-acetyltransferase n=1 Tax=Cytobacillus firmus TaxID=1399 RepID=UPI001C94FF99|nr:GNAT family N-acetyltransferase [Cytobacillus firmus]MBY6054752.1 GNAT family N-acetyltransferase [Cytobacillus firmus]